MAARYPSIDRVNWWAVILILLALAHALWRLDVAPPLGWDEGWTLTVARTWVERGRYGRLQAGQPVPVRLSAAPPVVASVALSFQVLGVGVWQGRLVIVLYALGSLLLLYDLTRRLFNRRTATGALAVVLLMTLEPMIHPMVVGRHVLAEAPMLFFLLAGYVCFLLTLQRSAWFTPLAVVCWGVGLTTKGQPLPFWILSLAVPLLVMLFRRRWRVASLLGIALLGSLGARWLLLELYHLLPDPGIAPDQLAGFTRTLALVLVRQVRVKALRGALIPGLPTALGLGYAAWKEGKKHIGGGPHDDLEVVRLSLLVLAGSWFAWYVLLSIGWIRYLFPAVFLGSMFVAALLSDWTDGYRLASTIKRAALALGLRGLNRQGVCALLAIGLVAATVPGAMYWLSTFFAVNSDRSAQEVAHFLNTQTPSHALIETYDPEVFFLLDRDYHYPPDEIHIPLIRGRELGEDVSIEFDPLAADPDYLINWHPPGFATVYDPVLETGAFRLLHVIGLYEIYERVR